MKLSTRTLDILKNFASVNNSLIFNPGNVISTISESRFIVGRAEVEESFPVKAAFYKNLDTLIRLIRTLPDAEVDFSADRITISSGRFKQVIRYASPEIVSQILAPKADPASRDFTWNVEFDLKAADFSVLDKLASITNAPNLVFECAGGGESIVVAATNESESSAPVSRMSTDATSQDKFRIVFLRDNLKLLPNDYHVSVHVSDTTKITRWDATGTDLGLLYFIAVELGSTYNA